MARPAGSLNKATIEKQIIAARLIDRSRTLNEPLAKEKLIELLGIAMGAMASWQPITEEMAARARDRGDAKAKAQKGNWKNFGEWFDRSGYICKVLIPFQSPTFRAIAIAPMPEEQFAPKPGEESDLREEVRLRVFEGGRIVKTVTATEAVESKA